MSKAGYFILSIIIVGVLIGFFFMYKSLETKCEQIDDLEFRLSVATSDLENAKGTIKNMEAELEQKSQEIKHLESDVRSVENELSSANWAIDVLKITAENNKFLFYYDDVENQYNLGNLKRYVNNYTWSEQYEKGVFDCSEMSAVLERYLENVGFNTYIAAGKTPGNPDTRHAWLLVEVSEGEYVPVEATTLNVVSKYYPLFDEYYDYDQLFEDIHEAMDYNEYEFDWWQHCNPHRWSEQEVTHTQSKH